MSHTDKNQALEGFFDNHYNRYKRDNTPIIVIMANKICFWFNPILNS